MAKYRVDTDKGSYEVETEDAPSTPGMEKLGGTPPPAAKPRLPYALDKHPEWENKNTFGGTMAKTLAAPATAIMGIAPGLIDFAKRGGHNPPSGGFLAEEPVTQALGNAAMAVGPEGARASAPALETVAKGAKGAAKGAVTSVQKARTSGPAVAGAAIGALTGRPHGAEIGGVIGALPGVIQGAVEGAKREMAGPPPAPRPKMKAPPVTYHDVPPPPAPRVMPPPPLTYPKSAAAAEPPAVGVESTPPTATAAAPPPAPPAWTPKETPGYAPPYSDSPGEMPMGQVTQLNKAIHSAASAKAISHQQLSDIAAMKFKDQGVTSMKDLTPGMARELYKDLAGRDWNPNSTGEGTAGTVFTPKALRTPEANTIAKQLADSLLGGGEQ